MKLTLLLLISLLGYWAPFTKLGKINCPSFNYFGCLTTDGHPAHHVNTDQKKYLGRTAFFTTARLKRDNERVEFTLLEKKRELKDVWLIFTIGIAIMSLLMVFIIAKNSRDTKKNNQILKINNKVMIAQNEYLQKTLTALEESHEENTRVMQIIAHDLRSPMAAIVGLSGFMINEHNLSSLDLEVISLINISGVDSLKFINEILERESSEIELKKETVDLNMLLTYCVTQLQYKANEKQQNIILKSTAISLKLNREKIWRVVSNLITNAIKFSSNESIILVYLKLFGGKAIITVKDKGIGIPEDLRDKIFSVSSQRKREGTAGEKSFGLGLAIAKQNIEAHGGTLSFESKVGKGTTFFIELPIS